MAYRLIVCDAHVAHKLYELVYMSEQYVPSSPSYRVEALAIGLSC